MDGKHVDETSVAKSDRRFSTTMVITCCIAVTAYFALYLAFKWVNPNATWDTALTAAWFAFWGGELVMLATIKRSKIDNKYESD